MLFFQRLAAVALLSTVLVPDALAADPRLPPGQDPGGTAIALIGSGVDYTKPQIASRVARDGEGELIGWDVIDDDRQPFTAADTTDAAGTAAAEALLAAYAKGRLVPVRAPRGDAQALAKAIAFTAGSPATIVAIALPLENDAMKMVVRQASERFKDRVFVVAGQTPPPAEPATVPKPEQKQPGPGILNLANVLVVMAMADVAGRDSASVIASTEVVVMPRGAAMFGANPEAPPRNAAEAVALAAASAACQTHGAAELKGSAAKAAALDASQPLTDNRAIRVLDPLCFYGGKRF